MDSNVYHLDFPQDQLPEPQDIPEFARTRVQDLAGESAKGIEFSLEQVPGNGSFRIVITVPQRMQHIVQSMESQGLRPSHVEPEIPMADETSCTVPRAFQIHHLGTPVHPQTVSDNPSNMARLSIALMEHQDTLPPEAIDYHQWTTLDADENTGVLTIHWDPPA